MTISHRERAKKDLAGVISGELSAMLNSPDLMRGRPFSRETVSALSLSVAEQIIQSSNLLEKMAQLAPRKIEEWLTTEQAAQLSGFSRPFIAALLDGDIFEGRVTRTEKGHRRVEAGDFRDWMERNRRPEGLPTTMRAVRSGPRDAAPVVEAETQGERKLRTTSRAHALARARSLGLG